MIVGAGEWAEMAYEFFTYDSDLDVVAFAVEAPYWEEGRQLMGLPVLSLGWPADGVRDKLVHVAISDSQVRSRLVRRFQEFRWSLVSYISSNNHIWHSATFGENCLVDANNTIHHGVRVGDCCMVGCGNHIGHRARIGDDCWLSAHVVISGLCDIGDRVYFGVNSCVRDGVSICSDVTVGMGAVVVGDITEPGTYVGCPARRV